MNQKMTDEEILHLATNLFEQAVEANSYWRVLLQFGEHIKNYTEEMLCSGAFYHIIHQALAESLLLYLARIYDQDGASISINNLVNALREITVNSLAVGVKERYVLCQNKFRHLLKPSEECFYEKEVAEQKQIIEMLNVEYRGTTVELSLEELINLYQKKFRTLKKEAAISNLREQRNKVYAHNDRSTNFDYNKVYSEFPLPGTDIEKLIEFAIECSQFVIEIMTGVHKVPEYVNIDDWEATLQLVRIGQKYRDRHIADLFNNE